MCLAVSHVAALTHQPKSICPCALCHAGCEAFLKRSELDHHLRSAAHEHVTLLSSQLARQSKAMDQLQQTVRDLESQGNSEKWAKASISKTQVEHVQTLEKEWSKQTKINESIAKVQQEQVHAVESQRHALESQFSQQAVLMHSLKASMTSGTKYQLREVLWKLDNLATVAAAGGTAKSSNVAIGAMIAGDLVEPYQAEVPQSCSIWMR